MSKKILILVFSTIMMLGVFTLAACNNDTLGAPCEVESFYSLQEAFDNGWVTKDDLQTIAFYHNDDSVPVYHEPLHVNITEKMGQDFVTYVDCQEVEHNIQIKYYGTYNGCVAAVINGCQHYLDVEDSENIAGVDFHYGSSQRILIWIGFAEV